MQNIIKWLKCSTCLKVKQPHEYIHQHFLLEYNIYNKHLYNTCITQPPSPIIYIVKPAALSQDGTDPRPIPCYFLLKFRPNLYTLYKEASLVMPSFGLHKIHLNLTILSFIVIELTQFYLHPSIIP